MFIHLAKLGKIVVVMYDTGSSVCILFERQQESATKKKISTQTAYIARLLGTFFFCLYRERTRNISGKLFPGSSSLPNNS